MKKILSFIAVLAVAATAVFAEPDSGEFWPSDASFDGSNFYLETRGDLVCRLYEFDISDTITHYGAGADLGFGYNHGGWLFGLNYAFSFFGDQAGSSISKMFMHDIQLNFRRALTNNSISFLPDWFEIVPGFGTGVVILPEATNTYVAPYIRASLELALRPGTDRFTPYIGADYNVAFAAGLGGAVGYPRVTIGYRMYPFGEAKAAPAGDPASITSTITPATGFTPDGDGVNDVAQIKTSVANLKAKPESWKVEICDQKDEVLKSWSGKGKIPNLEWDGTTAAGDKLFSSETYKIVTTIVPSEKDRARLGQDEVKNTATIKTGVMMEEIVPQKQWKIIVNTIYFDSNAATFDEITDEQSLANKLTLDSIAAQALALSDNILIEILGYANNVSNTEEENHDELIPLSLDRATAIKAELIKRGIKPENLTAIGKGGADPIAAWEDKAHWWKNRRVEFVVSR